jgi:hypothetical protein
VREDCLTDTTFLLRILPRLITKSVAPPHNTPKETLFFGLTGQFFSSLYNKEILLGVPVVRIKITYSPHV